MLFFKIVQTMPNGKAMIRSGFFQQRKHHGRRGFPKPVHFKIPELKLLFETIFQFISLFVSERF
jgi:hypothetical protein